MVGVHLYGQMAPLERVRELGRRAGAAGRGRRPVTGGASRWAGRSGSVGDIAATSFYPGKNLGAYGDAGAVITDDSPSWPSGCGRCATTAACARYEHDVLGRELAGWTPSRRWCSAPSWPGSTRGTTSGGPPPTATPSCWATWPACELPAAAEGNEHVWHLYVVRCERRDEVLAGLTAAGIGPACTTRRRSTRWRRSASSAASATSRSPRAAADEIVSLPMFPGITHDQQARVARVVRGVLDGAGQDRTRGAGERAGQESAA